MRGNDLGVPRPRRSARSWQSGPGVVACAVLLAALATGCERAGPVAANDQRARPADTSQAAPTRPADPEADGGATIEAIATPAADTQGKTPMPTPMPMPMPMPTPTVGASSAGATSTAAEPPILRAVRVGKHPGLDRLVFEFDGAGLPAWHVEYVDRPVRDCGSGDPVHVAGDAWLQVRFNGAHAHTPEGAPTSGPRRRAIGLTVLRELVRICDFEAEVTWVAGLARPNPYTARVLAGPSRLVIDIAH